MLGAARAENKPHVSARMWAYRSLGPEGVNVFDFTVSRHRDGPQDFLKNYSGTLLGDCYTGFESIMLASDDRLVRAACHAHARRYVYEAREYHPLEAAQLLAWYRQLYDVEDQARGKCPEEILALRRKLSVPIMDQLRLWLDGDAARKVLPKSRLGEAVRYLNNQWEALTVFLGDGRVPIDNNDTEQLMKQVATGRKNWLFIGSVEAGYRAAILLTIVSTAHRYHLGHLAVRERRARPPAAWRARSGHATRRPLGPSPSRGDPSTSRRGNSLPCRRQSHPPRPSSPVPAITLPPEIELLALATRPSPVRGARSPICSPTRGLV